jgi:hypothetical protein
MTLHKADRLIAAALGVDALLATANTAAYPMAGMGVAEGGPLRPTPAEVAWPSPTVGWSIRRTTARARASCAPKCWFVIRPAPQLEGRAP